MLQRTQMLQRTRKDTIGQRSTRVPTKCSTVVFTTERVFMLFLCVRLFMLFIREILFLVITKENFFLLFKFTPTVYKSEINFVLFCTYIIDGNIALGCGSGVDYP